MTEIGRKAEIEAMGPGEEIHEVCAAEAPEPVGPYSQAVRFGPLIFASGQIPLDPTSGTLATGEIEAQTRRAIANLAAVLEAAGSSLERVLQTTIYLTDLSLFPRVNAVYAELFRGEPSPARATVGVAALPLGAAIEIAAVAALDSTRR